MVLCPLDAYLCLCSVIRLSCCTGVKEHAFSFEDMFWCRQWTLNWNEIDDKILVGSCPRSTKDVVCCALAVKCNLAAHETSMHYFI